MRNKKALSSIVSTLVFLLLVLVAVAIIWGTVKFFLNKNAAKVSLDTITLDLTIESVNVQNDTGIIVNVKRNKGKGEFKGIQFIFDDGESSEIIQVNYELKELERKNFIFNLQILNASELETVSIALVFEAESGKEFVGEIKDIFRISRNQHALPCTDNCNTFNFECGNFIICGNSIDCGNCSGYGPTFACNSSGRCECSDQCSTFNYECGTFVICEMDTNCGDCSGYGPTYFCNATGRCISP